MQAETTDVPQYVEGVPSPGLSLTPLEPTLETFVPLTDGTHLATDVYMPPTVARRGSPMALLRTPYGKRGVLDAAPQLAALLGEHGIGLVAQDVRGKFDSTGTATPFAQELVDGLETVHWLCEQRWCDGRLFPIGDSYAGFTAWCIASSGHNAVRGAVTCVTTTDIAAHWMYRQGIFRLQMNAGWATFAFGSQTLPPLPSTDPDWSVRPLRALDYGGASTDLLEYVIRHPPGSAEWISKQLGGAQRLSAKVDVPVLHSGGWWDLMSRGQVQDWQRAASRARGQILVMGGTDHLANRFADWDTRTQGDRIDVLTQLYADQVLPFISALLRDEGPYSHARWEVVHDGWGSSSEWPPAETRPETLYLVDGSGAAFGPEGGGLSKRSETIRQVVTWVHDPNELVPSLEPFIWGALPDLPDERDVQVRDDVLTFSSGSLSEPLDIVGQVEAVLVVQASVANAHVVATLCDVYPDGRTLRIAEGAARTGAADRAAEVTIDLGPIGYRIRPGHRLRLAIAGSCFPRYLWCTGTEDDPWEAISGSAVQLLLEIGPQSFLRLDVRR